MTTERIDHVAGAFASLRGPMAPGAEASALIAQVHATLALVEQQRIANLIALFGAHESIEAWDRWPEIAAALGVES